MRSRRVQVQDSNRAGPALMSTLLSAFMPARSARTVVAAAAFLALGMLAALAPAAQAGDRTGDRTGASVWRDRGGTAIGTIERDRYGNGFVLRDRAGRTVGLLKPDFYGNGFVLRDRSGRTIGVLVRE
jgi:hypothetical protein